MVPEIIFFLSSVVNSSLEQPSIQGSIVEPQIFLLQTGAMQLGTNASALYSGSGVPSNSNGANGIITLEQIHQRLQHNASMLGQQACGIGII